MFEDGIEYINTPGKKGSKRQTTKFTIIDK